jgi:hypothetical protein
MRGQVLAGLFLLLVVPALVAGQSLTELAKEEKERRKKNKESGKEVLVITEKELAETTGTIANPSDGTATPAPTSRASSPGRARNPSISEDDEEDEPITDIAADAPLEAKLRTFEAMKLSYSDKVKEIDQKIQENNTRIAQIQEDLVSSGGTGLPTAPQADRTPRNPANIPGLRSEQEELRRKNQALQAEKKKLKDELLQKGRRAGIPAGYLRF